MINKWQRSVPFLEKLLIFASLFSVLGMPAAWADLPPVNDLPLSAKTVQDWVAQMEAATVQVTAVKLSPTAQGLQIILETAEGQLDVPTLNPVDNALIANISNATIAENFEQVEPIAGIARVEVTGLPGDRVRVAITGTDAPPVAEIRSEAQGLVFAVTPGTMTGEQEEAIKIVVTGEQEEGDRVPDTSVGTRTDTPLRDIPQSIQVVPRQVLQDRQARSITDGLENVSGVTSISNIAGSRDYFTIRGFEVYSNSLVNGLPDPQISSDGSFVNVERLEVLKGPASVLYGETGFSGIGGTVNFITKQPLPDPFYEISATIGSFDDYQGTIDLSGPLNDSKTALYRFNAGYRSTESFVDFNEARKLSIAPDLSFSLGQNTDLVVEGDVNILERNGQQPDGLPAVGSVLPNPNGRVRRSFNSTGPGTDNLTINGRVGYSLEHRFNENWKLRNAFRYVFYDDDDRGDT